MSNYNSLKTTIDANIKQNGVQAITGQILNSVLIAMVNTLGTGYSFAGVATTATNPGSPDAKVFYIANGKGTYTNFGGIQVTEDDVVVLYWDSSWHKVQTGIASQNIVGALMSTVENNTEDIEELKNRTTGNGIYKNAYDYGFMPDNDADTNSIAIQNCLNGGGRIIVDYPGEYKVSKSLLLDSNTELVFGNNVYISKTKGADDKYARWQFINRGALTKEFNENIKIVNLRLKTNGLGVGNDRGYLIGQMSQIVFYRIKDLTIDGFEMLDGTDAGTYAIQISDFNNVLIENVKIVSQKDGIHFGGGKNFAIRHCHFLTNDDAIALNAQDYPTSSPRLGWIENGIIEDIHFLAADSSYHKGRGVYMLGGSWLDWESGMAVRKYGDCVVSNGRIYRTYDMSSLNNGTSKETLISTIAPTHTYGTQTYSDGVTWLLTQTTDICYNAGVRNVIMRDIYFEREEISAFTINFDDDKFSRSYYPGSDAPVFENIIVENVANVNGALDYLGVIRTPCKSLKFINGECKVNVAAFNVSKENQGLDYGVLNLLMIGTSFDFSESSVIVNCSGGNNRDCRIKIGESIKYDNVTPSNIGENVVVVSNDIGLGDPIDIKIPTTWFIRADGKWGNGTVENKVFFPISSGDVIRLTKDAGSTFYGVIKNIDNLEVGGQPVFASGFDGRQTGSNEVEITNTDGNYIWVNLLDAVNQHFFINGTEI